MEAFPCPVIFTGIPHDWISHARKRCVEVIDELDIRDYIFPIKMPNGKDRVLSEVRTSDLEAAAFIHARFNVSDIGVKAQVGCQSVKFGVHSSPLRHTLLTWT